MGLSPERDLINRREVGKLVVATTAARVLSAIKSKEARALTQEELGPVKHYIVGEGENKIDMGPLIFPLKDGTGMHYASEGMENFSYPQGYAVRGVMWEVYKQYGREHIWGPPESRPYIDNIGRICQPFQKGIFQLTTNRTEELLALSKKNEKEPFKEYTWLDKYLSSNKLQLTKPPEWDNVFDKLSEPLPSNSLENIFGKIVGERHWDFTPSPARNDWLENKFIPRPQQIAYPSANPTWEQIKSAHLALLEANPKIKDYYFSNPQWLEQYGLPVAVKEYNNVITIRCQRAALHLWKVDLPWAKKGEITVANAVLLVKEKTDGAIIPTDSLLAELSDRYFDIWGSDLISQGGLKPDDQPPEIIGPELFVSELQRVLNFMKERAPDFYREVIKYTFTITPRDRARGQGLGMQPVGRILYYDPIENPIDDVFLSLVASTLVHEANHSKIDTESLLGGNAKYVELTARKAEYNFQIAIGETGENALKWIVNIDNPKYQWWRR